LHEKALFLHKNFKNFLGMGYSLLPRPHRLPFCPLHYYKFLDPPLPLGKGVPTNDGAKEGRPP